MLYAAEFGTSIFFDTGSRGKTPISGLRDEQSALHQFLKCSDVLLFTSEEALASTGKANPIILAHELVKIGVSTKWAIVKMGT